MSPVKCNGARGDGEYRRHLNILRARKRSSDRIAMALMRSTATARVSDSSGQMRLPKEYHRKARPGRRRTLSSSECGLSAAFCNFGESESAKEKYRCQWWWCCLPESQLSLVRVEHPRYRDYVILRTWKHVTGLSKQADVAKSALALSTCDCAFSCKCSKYTTEPADNCISSLTWHANHAVARQLPRLGTWLHIPRSANAHKGFAAEEPDRRPQDFGISSKGDPR